MKRIFEFPVLLAMLMTFAIFTSCGDDTDPIDDGTLGDVLDDVIDDGTVDEVVEYDLIVNSSNADSGERTLEIEAVPGSEIIVNLHFTSDSANGDDSKMRRVYGTEYSYGDTEVGQYEFDSSYDLKGDGSIDIASADGYEFIETLYFTAPENLDEVDQYNFWTTSGRGDFRDVSKRNAIAGDAYGSVTIKGAEVESLTDIADASATMHSFTQTILFAPTADGTSESFISLFDAQTHTINEGIEKMAFWDFGYFYGENTGASFYSVYDYPEVFTLDNGATYIHVSEFVGADLSELNRFYFAMSSIDFDSVSTSDDLEAIDEFSLTSDRVQELAIGDVVEFVDQYGNKGLIKVTDLDPGYAQGDSITFDVKVQVNYQPIVL